MPQLSTTMKRLSAKPKDAWTAEDGAKYDMSLVLKRFPEHHNQLTLDQVKWVDKHRGELEMAAWIKKLKEGVAEATKVSVTRHAYLADGRVCREGQSQVPSAGADPGACGLGRFRRAG